MTTVVSQQVQSEIDFPSLRKYDDGTYMSRKLPEVIEEEKTVVYSDTQVHLLILRPLGTENETLPAVIFIHGGGWTTGSRYTHGKPAWDICVQNRVAVVFVNYTLAPEVQFPFSNEECFAALGWVYQHGNDINIDVNKLVMCGDSSGGHLTASTALMAKDRGLEDALKSQILVYPVVAPPIWSFPSNNLFGNGEYVLTTAQVTMAKKCYLGHDDRNFDNKYAFPLVATVDELKGLPPTLMLTAEADTLRDEGESYARKLTKAGVPTVAIRTLGTVHGYFNVDVKETLAYRQTMAIISNALKEAFSNK
ncbi:Alpha/Beta hydrolase protein [Phascolomyces articulosus]|uniref:Alpha/Beta hydrolase protein n=1 Tax=Phascolomyces articulosus TaxID=60185 RepID=A0AAD5JYE1_9FUNG|nr:Alpha/Beta hydrolase protein [Phascolomyces articulosus]